MASVGIPLGEFNVLLVMSHTYVAVLNCLNDCGNLCGIQILIGLIADWFMYLGPFFCCFSIFC